MGDPDTALIRRRAPRISEETQVLVKVGSLISCAVALVIATIFVWQIKTNSEQALSKTAEALAEQRAFREELKPIIEQHRRLWWDYELRTAGRSGLGQVGP
jgi:hypothetical protein